jgi:autotransporter-associated beta strand protein
MGWGGTNTFSGTINIIGNKLALSGADSADGHPNINIASGCALSIGASFVGGTAAIGNLAGAGNVDVAFGATTGIRTMQVNQTTNAVFAGTMTDSSAGRIFALTKTGPASLTLSGTNGFTGPTTVNNGTLVVNGTLLSNSIVTVNSGATFGGTGTVGSTVSYAGGSSATTTAGLPLTVTTLDMAGNATMNVTTASPLSAGSYPLINYGSLTSSGQFTSLNVGGAGLASGATASVGVSNNVVSLNVVGGSATPVPITFSRVSGGLVLNWPAGQGFQLQVQTNGLTTNWITISNVVPPITNTIVLTNKSVFYRLKN